MLSRARADDPRPLGSCEPWGLPGETINEGETIMALKAWWKARLMSSGGVHLDSDTDTYTVRFMTTPERDLGRVIFTDMSPDVARKMARDLVKAADHADTLNGKMAARNARRADLFEALTPGSTTASRPTRPNGSSPGGPKSVRPWRPTRSPLAWKSSRSAPATG
jgi:hypothetical protein